MFSSKRDDWETPQDFFNRLNNEFHFTLDPCADEFNHKCDKWFSKHDNGLEQSWGGETVFCNPPYGRNIGKWVKKASEETQDDATTVVMLIPARTDTAYFHDYIYGKADIRFLRGRLKFGKSKNGAPFPSMIVIFRGGNKCHTARNTNMKAQNITVDINKLSIEQLEMLKQCISEPQIIKQINDREAFIKGWMSEKKEKEYAEKYCY